MQQALQHLQQDEKLALILENAKPIIPAPHTDLYKALIRAIVGQQLSVKAANTIHNRFLSLFENAYPEPTFLLQLPDETLRGVGLSGQKLNYLKHVANFKLSGNLDHAVIDKLSDDAVTDHLVQIKGVGRWTAQMILMFALDRPDIFPADDIGIQQAMKRVYGLTSEGKELKKEMENIAATWAPYRSLASKYLWKSLDNE